MAKHFKVATLLDLASVKAGQVLQLPLIDRQEALRYRVRDVTASVVGPGSWASHTEKSPELYIILAGTVIYDTPAERFVVSAGEAILFDVGDSHATEIPVGILSVAVNLTLA
jgi:mannose-6-phosphate isomerase-like protein (cupin superfamily)